MDLEKSIPPLPFPRSNPLRKTRPPSLCETDTEAADTPFQSIHPSFCNQFSSCVFFPPFKSTPRLHIPSLVAACPPFSPQKEVLAQTEVQEWMWWEEGHHLSTVIVLPACCDGKRRRKIDLEKDEEPQLMLSKS